MQLSLTNLGRIVVAFVCGILLLFLLIDVWRYFHTGTIVVTTDGANNSNVITLSTLKGSSEVAEKGEYIKQNTKYLSATVPLGSYVISVSGKVLSESKTVDLNRHETLHYSLNAPKITSPEPVASVSATGVVASNSKLLYLDTSTNVLEEINSQDSVDDVGSQDLQSVAWADTNYGIGQDNKHHLYIIDNGSVTPLQPPEAYQQNETVLYSITKSRHIYLSFGSRIYFGSVVGGFKKIYVTDNAPDKIVGSDLGVLLFNTPDADDESQDPNTVLVSSNGSQVHESNFKISGAAWSPNNSMIALLGNSSYGTTNSIIVNDSFKQMVVLPNSNIGSVTWINNNTLVYSVGNVIWSYNISLKQSSVIAEVDPQNTITQLIADQNSNYLYVVSQGNGTGEIDRVGLRGQNIPAVSYQVGVFFPSVFQPIEQGVGSCSFNYINFIHPTLNVSYYVSLPNCKSAVDLTLLQDNINISQLTINYANTVGGD